MDYASVRDWLELANLAYTGVSVSSQGGDAEILETLTMEGEERLRFVADPERFLSVPTVSSLLQPTLGMKKWRATYPLPETVLAQRAIAGFVERNAQVERKLPKEWILDDMRSILDRWLPPCTAHPLPRLGPGAVAEHYSYLRKRSSLHRLSDCFWYWDTPHEYRRHPSDAIVGHDVSRLCAVPKDWNKMRLITVEPYVNTVMQQAARLYVFECLLAGPLGRDPRWRRFWEAMPTVQRRRALIGSRNGSLATIDLSDASDGISYGLVARVMPGHVMAWLDVSRTSRFETPDGVTHRTAIYAGMGNATTFIVETLLFAAYCYAIQNRRGGPSRAITVFGDDIVCSSELAANLVAISDPEMPFFRVNREKSYWGSSHFRESCGTFAYNGLDVSLIRFRGYDLRQYSGRLALADLHSRLYSSDLASHWIVAHEIAESGALPNYEHKVPNHPSISDATVPYQTQQLRWNRRLQVLEAKESFETPALRGLPPTEEWMVAASNISAIRTERYGKTQAVCVPSGRTRVCHRWSPVY